MNTSNTQEQLFSIDNLDAINDPEELRTLADTLTLYARYAAHKSVAVESRLAGNILEARMNEIMCDTIYNEIPSQFRQW